MRNMIDGLRAWARSVKRQNMVLWFCCKQPKTPWFVKALTLCVVAYALSPIDLIPDFIPVLGYLDDLILLPLGILLVVIFHHRGVLHKPKPALDEGQWRGCADYKRVFYPRGK